MDRTSQELELYTIPSYSSWFCWNNIHEVERLSLREFFDGMSVTRSPKIYKEYRDFIISKYREDPSQKLSFTTVRKSLVGDISLLLKVFTFLEKWGLINFNATDNNKSNNDNDASVRTESFGCEDDEENWRVEIEEGAPHGVRVVAAPNSMKPIVPPQHPSVAVGGGVFVGESGFKWGPLLASYSDVYGELMKEEKKGLICGSCKENCDCKHYEYSKEESFIICEKCFKAGNYDKTKLADDFKLKNSTGQTTIWTEPETLLLLESVLKHGDEWDLVAKNVQTKSKLECISKLIELPFGDLIMLGASQRKSGHLDVISDISNSKQVELVSSNEPPAKRVCMGPTSDVRCSLMKQVARISTLVGPHVTASAADAAVAAICYENQCSREIFDHDDNYVDPEASRETSEQNSKAAEDELVVEEERRNVSVMKKIDGILYAKSIIPVNLRTRAASATALGGGAANAKMLADKEEREMGHLLATMIEAQMKKFGRKMKYIEDLSVIMEKDHAQLEELEESLIVERMFMLQRLFSASITKPNALTSNQILN